MNSVKESGRGRRTLQLSCSVHTLWRPNTLGTRELLLDDTDVVLI